MDEEKIAQKVKKMSRGEQEKRLAELNAKLGITVPHSTGPTRGDVPPDQSIEEVFEREYLKKALGYSS